MAREKKDGVKCSIFLDRKLEEGLRAYAAEHEMTLTAVIERSIRRLLDAEGRTADRRDPYSEG